jgi:predicted metalloenzyme YecM
MVTVFGTLAEEFVMRIKVKNQTVDHSSLKINRYQKHKCFHCDVRVATQLFYQKCSFLPVNGIASKILEKAINAFPWSPTSLSQVACKVCARLVTQHNKSI